MGAFLTPSWVPPTGRVFLGVHDAWVRSAQALEGRVALEWRIEPVS